jgi:uncharacterized repeat protein (TIGR02543 family)
MIIKNISEGTGISVRIPYPRRHFLLLSPGDSAMWLYKTTIKYMHHIMDDIEITAESSSEHEWLMARYSSKFTVNPFQEGVISVIAYLLDGGTNDPDNPNSYVEGIGVPEFLPPTKEGYTFNGWEPSSITPEDTGDIVITASWLENFSITYANMEDAENDPDNPDIYVEGIGVPSFKPPLTNPPGKVFVGWEPSSIPEEETGNVTITALWSQTEEPPSENP